MRFLTILLYAASAGLVFLLGREWTSFRAALLAALAYSLLPVFAGMGFVVTPDQALLLRRQVQDVPPHRLGSGVASPSTRV